MADLLGLVDAHHEFTDANEVYDLRDTEEGSHDEHSGECALEQRSRAFVAEDTPE